MHPDAIARLRQLILAALDAVVINDDHEVELESAFHSLNPIEEFLVKQYERWIHHDYAFIYVYLSINTILAEHDLRKSPGPLASAVSPAQRSQVAEAICDYWVKMPKNYVLNFPLPSLPPLANDLEIAPGYKFTNVTIGEVDAASMQMGDTIGSLVGARPKRACACLQVIGSGLMHLGRPSEIPAASAIRIAKIVIAIGKVMNAIVSIQTTVGSPKFVRYTQQDELQTARGNVLLPDSFANSIKKCAFIAPKGIAADVDTLSALNADFFPIGVVIAGDASLAETKLTPKKNSAASIEQSSKQHCGRIATAAEWLFDAETEGASAMSFVQVAISFEALYGSDGDHIVKTLSNRVAYSLGRSQIERETLARQFSDFYGTRSAVVHSGTTRLTKAQGILFLTGKEILKRCLRNEIRLIQSVNSPTGALAAALRQVDQQ